MSESHGEMGLLGKQILLVLAAYQRPADRHFCSVRSEEFVGSDLLTEGLTRRFLIYDSLPGTSNNKAIAIDGKALIVELTPFDDDRVRGELTLPAETRLDRDALWRGRRKLGTVMRGSPDVEREHGMRALWVIPWTKLSDEDLQAAITCLDYLDAEGAYLEDLSLQEGGGVSMSGGSGGGQRLEMRLGLQLQLIQVQVPILAARTEMQTAMRLSLEFTQMLRFERLLERNPTEAIVAHLEKDSSPEGQQCLANFILFKLARDVKNAAAEKGRAIDWSEARRIVRKMMYKVAA